MSDFETRLLRIEDEAAIRDLVARFADTCIHGDHEGFRALWADDGLWEIGAPFSVRCEGIEAIVDMLHKLRDERNFFTQLVPTGVIEIDGDHARARWPVREVATGPGETYYDNLAMYYDVLVRQDGGWRFAHRRYHYMWLNNAPFPGMSLGAPGKVEPFHGSAAGK